MTVAADASKAQQLVDMGFTDAQARTALVKFDNNVERAIDWMFSGGYEDMATGPQLPPARANSPFDPGPAPPSPPMVGSPARSPQKPAIKGLLTAGEVDKLEGPVDPSKLSEDEQLRLAIEASLQDTSGVSGPLSSGLQGDTGSGASSIYGGFGSFAPVLPSTDKRARSRQRHDGSASPARGMSAGIGPPPPRNARSTLSTRPSSPSPEDSMKGSSEHIEHHGKGPAESPGIVPGDKNPFRVAMSTDRHGDPTAIGDNAFEQTAPAPSGDELPSYDTIVPPLPGRPYQLDAKDTDLQAALALSMQALVDTDSSNDANSADVIMAQPAKETVEHVKGMKTDAGLIPEGTPDRAEGAPMVYTADTLAVMWLVCVIQCLQAVPQVRDAVEHLQWHRSADMEDLMPSESTIATLQDLFKAAREHRAASITVDDSVLLATEIQWTLGMPPQQKAFDAMQSIANYWTAVAGEASTAAAEPSLIDLAPTHDIHPHRPDDLFHTAVIPPGDDQTEMRAPVLQVVHDAATEKTGMQCIAKAIWTANGSYLLSSLGDIFAVAVAKAPRAYGQGVVEKMQIDESIYLDRFLQSNTARAFSCRGSEGMVKGNLQRAEATLAELDSFKDRNVEKTLTAAIAYYESGLAGAHMPESERVEKVQQISSQLKRVKDAVTAKKAALRDEIKALHAELEAVWDVPELQEHRYDLRSIAYYTGFDSPTSYHCYVKQPDGRWWKTCGGEATETTFEAIQKDATGLHFDQGPFLMVYSRDGPRPSEVENPLVGPPETLQETQASPADAPASPADTDMPDALPVVSVPQPSMPASGDAHELDADFKATSSTARSDQW